MALSRFHADDELRSGQRIGLSDAESHYARRPRRLGVGGEVILFDGRGSEARGRIIEVGPRVTVEVITVERKPFDGGLHLILATLMPKGPRQNVLIETCTELGVAAFWAVRCARSASRKTLRSYPTIVSWPDDMLVAVWPFG